MSPDDLFQELFLDHGKNPRGVAPLPSPSVIEEASIPSCGDHLHLELLISPKGDLVDVCALARGCLISRASASIMVEVIKGQKIPAILETIRQLIRRLSDDKKTPLSDELEAICSIRKFPIRLRCALLPWECMKKSLSAFSV